MPRFVPQPESICISLAPARLGWRGHRPSARRTNQGVKQPSPSGPASCDRSSRPMSPPRRFEDSHLSGGACLAIAAVPVVPGFVRGLFVRGAGWIGRSVPFRLRIRCRAVADLPVGEDQELSRHCDHHDLVGLPLVFSTSPLREPFGFHISYYAWSIGAKIRFRIM